MLKAQSGPALLTPLELYSAFPPNQEFPSLKMLQTFVDTAMSNPT